MISGLALYLVLERIVLVPGLIPRLACTVPVSGKDCPGLIPGIALYLFLERIVLD